MLLASNITNADCLPLPGVGLPGTSSILDLVRIDNDNTGKGIHFNAQLQQLQLVELMALNNELEVAFAKHEARVCGSPLVL